MDQKLVDQSIDYHGPDMVDGLYKEQVNVKLPNFLTLPQNSKNKETPKDVDFEKMVVSFISKKADLIFKTKQPDQKKTTSEDASAYLAKLPPLEFFMGVQSEDRKEHYYKSVEKGDVVIGSVAAVQQQGLLIHLISLDGHKSRDIKQLKIAAFCPSRELPKLYAHESPIDAFAIRDKVRGIVTSISKDKDVVLVIISLLQDKLPQSQPDIKIGLISDEELPEYLKHIKEGRIVNYHRELMKSQGFSNPSTVTTLTDMFDLDESMAPSLMRGLHAPEYSKTDFAEELRKAQSYRLALKSVAEGVDYFKKGKHVEAMQHLNKALDIDSENVEGLVARGALYANNESYSRAIEDFEKALEINPSHNNAKTYMSETLLVHARGLMDQNMEPEAAVYLEKVLKLNPDLKEAQRVLGEIKKKMAEQELPKEAIVLTDSEPEEVIDEKSLIKKTADTLRMIMEEEESERRNKRKKMGSPERSRSTDGARRSYSVEESREKPERTTSDRNCSEFQKIVSKAAPLSPGTEAFIKSKFEEEKARSLGLEYSRNPDSRLSNSYFDETDQDLRYSNSESKPSHYDGDDNEAKFSNSYLPHGYSEKVREKDSRYKGTAGHDENTYRYENEISSTSRGYAQSEDKDIRNDDRYSKSDFKKPDRGCEQHFETDDRSYGQSISFHEIMEEQLRNQGKTQEIVEQTHSQLDPRMIANVSGTSQFENKEDADAWKDRVNQFMNMLQNKNKKEDSLTDLPNPKVARIKPLQTTASSTVTRCSVTPERERYGERHRDRSDSRKKDRYTGRNRSRSRSPENDRYTGEQDARSRSDETDRYTARHERSRSPCGNRHSRRDLVQPKDSLSEDKLTRNRSRSPVRDQVSGKQHDSQRSKRRSSSTGKHGRSSSGKRSVDSRKSRTKSPTCERYSENRDRKRGSRSASPSKSKRDVKHEKKHRKSSSGNEPNKLEKLSDEHLYRGSASIGGYKEMKQYQEKNDGKGQPSGESITDRLKRLSQLDAGHDLNKQTVNLDISSLSADVNKQKVSLTDKIVVTRYNERSNRDNNDEKYKDIQRKVQLSNNPKEKDLSPKHQRKSSREEDFSSSGRKNKDTKTKTEGDGRKKDREKGYVKLSHDSKRDKRNRDQERYDRNTNSKTQEKKTKNYSPDKSVHSRSGRDQLIPEKRRRSRNDESPVSKKSKLMKSKWDEDSSSDESVKERKKRKSDQVKETLAEMEGFLQMLKENKKKK